MKRSRDSLSNSFDTLPPGDTDPSELAPASQPEGYDEFARLVHRTMRLELARQLEPLKPLPRAVRSLTDAFNAHTSDEAKRSAAMLKVLAVRSVMPTLALVVAAIALTVVLSSGPATADGTVCTPQYADAGGP